jgi:hypothetical protein
MSTEFGTHAYWNYFVSEEKWNNELPNWHVSSFCEGNWWCLYLGTVRPIERKESHGSGWLSKWLWCLKPVVQVIQHFKADRSVYSTSYGRRFKVWECIRPKDHVTKRDSGPRIRRSRSWRSTAYVIQWFKANNQRDPTILRDKIHNIEKNNAQGL